MSNYTLSKIQEDGFTFYAIFNEENMKYFAGYDFMGSVCWEYSLTDAYWMYDSEAYEIMADLRAAE